MITPTMLLPSLLLLSSILLFVLLHQHLRRKRHKRHMETLRQLLLLRQLIGGFQRHRGLSNGVLCGDDSLRANLAQIREQLNGLMLLAASMPLHQPKAWQYLMDHWSRLSTGHNLNPDNNLKQHHLIIRNSIFLLQDLALEQDLSGRNPRFSHLPLIWNEVLQAAEWAGQARALGTGIAAAGQGNVGQRIRLKFLHQKIQQLTTAAFQALSPQFTAWMPSAQQTLKDCQTSVMQLLTCIEYHLLADEAPGISAAEYFQLASRAIDGLLALVDINLEALQYAQTYEAVLPHQ